MRHLISKLSKWGKLVRSEEWLAITFLPLFLPFYYLLLTSESSYGRSLYNFALIMAFGLCCASFGFVINTLFDRKQDQRAGKTYAMTSWPAARIVLFLVVLFTLSVVILIVYMTDWEQTVSHNTGGEFEGASSMLIGRNQLAVSPTTGLPWNPRSAHVLLSLRPDCQHGFVLALAAVFFLLAIIYSTPPLRLKERGIWGPLTIALSEFALPQLFLFAVFGFFSWETILLPALFFVVGLRAILFHQLLDYGNDVEALVTTFTTVKGIEWVAQLVIKVLMPMELVVLAVTLVYTNGRVPGTLLYAVICVVFFYLWSCLRRGLGAELVPVQYTALDDFYWLCWPFFLLIVGLSKSWFFALLLVIHLCITSPFWRPYRNDLREFLRCWSQHTRSHP